MKIESNKKKIQHSQPYSVWQKNVWVTSVHLVAITFCQWSVNIFELNLKFVMRTHNFTLNNSVFIYLVVFRKKNKYNLNLE